MIGQENEVHTKPYLGLASRQTKLQHTNNV